MASMATFRLVTQTRSLVLETDADASLSLLPRRERALQIFTQRYLRPFPTLVVMTETFDHIGTRGDCRNGERSTLLGSDFINTTRPCLSLTNSAATKGHQRGGLKPRRSRPPTLHHAHPAPFTTHSCHHRCCHHSALRFPSEVCTLGGQSKFEEKGDCAAFVTRTFTFAHRALLGH